MRILRKVVVVLLLGFVVGSPWASASQPRLEAPSCELNRTAQDALKLFAPLWNLFTNLWAKEGCGIDPLGGCVAATASPNENTDEGCGIDPWGGCTLGH